MADKNNLTTLAKRLRPLLGTYIQNLGGQLIGEGPGIDIVKTGDVNTVGLGGDTILVYHIGGTPTSEYAPTPAGFAAALAAAVAGDLIFLYQFDISGNYTIPANVTIQGVGEGSVLTGDIINNGLINDLKIIGHITNNSVARHIKLYVSSGTGWIQNALGGNSEYCEVAIQGNNVIGADISSGRIIFFVVGYLSGTNTIGIIIDGADVHAFFCRSLAKISFQVGACKIISQCAGVTSEAGSIALFHTAGNAQIYNSSFSDLTGGTERAIDATIAGMTLTDCTWIGTTTGSWVSGSGDRSVFNALTYQSLHANDIDQSTGIHWTEAELNLLFGNAKGAANAPPFYLKVATNGRNGEATYPWQQNGILYGNNKTFIFYMADDTDNWCVVYNHETQTWNAPIEVADGHADDVHNYLSAIFDAEGYIHIFYGCHSSPLYYKKSTNPYDISAWSAETTLDSQATYPKAIKNNAGELYIFYRSNNIDLDHNRYLKFRKSTDNGANWLAAVTIIDSGNDDIWVYAGIIGLGSDDSIHIIWTWRNSGGLTDPAECTDVCYMKSLDGGTTWEKSTGVDYVLPADPADAEEIATGQYMLAMQVALDEDNNPQIVYIVSDPGSWFVDNDIHYCYLSGGVWQDDIISGTGYGFGTHIQVDGSVFYIFSSQLILGKDEIVMLQSLDNGASWTLYQLTSGSAVNNILMNTKTNTNGGIEIAWTQGTDVWYMSEDWIIQLRLDNLAITVDDTATIDLTLAAGEITANLKNTTVVAGSYINANIAVDAQGRLTSAANGSAIGQYLQFLYEVSGGTFTFLTDIDGNPLMGLQDLE